MYLTLFPHESIIGNNKSQQRIQSPTVGVCSTNFSCIDVSVSQILLDV